MSESVVARENVAVIRRVYDAFRQKDLGGILDVQARDVVWSVAGPADRIPWAGPLRGPEGVAEFLRVLGEWLAPDLFDINEYLTGSDTVVALGYQRGIVRPTGAPYEFDFVHVWKLREGKVTSFRVYYDTAYLGGILGAERAAS